MPVPRMLHLCEDDGVLGTAFFVMEFVDGTVFWDPALPELTNAQRAKVYDEQNRALAALHSVDPAKVGLADFGKAGSYFARQRDRWTKQYRASETERIEDMETLIAWLRAERAARRRPRLAGARRLPHRQHDLHAGRLAPAGGHRLGAVDHRPSVLGPGLPVHAVAPAQPATPCAASPASTAPRSASRPRRSTSPSIASAWGWQHIPHWNFCLAFSFFRLAAIVQGVKKRGLDGNASNPERARKIRRDDADAGEDGGGGDLIAPQVAAWVAEMTDKSHSIRKRIEFDAETWQALDGLARDRMASLQELADEAFRDLLKKHNRPTTLKEMLKASVRAHPDNDPAKPGPAKLGKKRRG